MLAVSFPDEGRVIGTAEPCSTQLFALTGPVACTLSGEPEAAVVGSVTVMSSAIAVDDKVVSDTLLGDALNGATTSGTGFDKAGAAGFWI